MLYYIHKTNYNGGMVKTLPTLVIKHKKID